MKDGERVWDITIIVTITIILLKSKLLKEAQTL